MKSLHDLHIRDVVVASDCVAAMVALSKPAEWHRYRFLLAQIMELRNQFENCSFEPGISPKVSLESRDGRFQSYLALGGPSWFHDRIARKAL